MSSRYVHILRGTKHPHGHCRQLNQCQHELAGNTTHADSPSDFHSGTHSNNGAC